MNATENQNSETTDGVEFLNAKIKKCGIETTGQFGKFMDLASAFHGKVVVNSFELDLFAAALHAAVSAGQADKSLWQQFEESFPAANAGRFIGS